MSQNSPDRLDGLGTRLWDTRPPESLHAALYRSKCRPTVKVAVTGRHLVRRYQLLGVVGMSRIRWKAAVGIG